jgi:hypothetical protein
MTWTDPSLSRLDALAAEEMARDIAKLSAIDKRGRKHLRKYAPGTKCPECGAPAEVNGLCRRCDQRKMRRANRILLIVRKESQYEGSVRTPIQSRCC